MVTAARPRPARAEWIASSTTRSPAILPSGDQYIRQGLSSEDAARAARRRFGGVAQTKEVYRQVRSFAWLDDVARDVRFGARTLRRNRRVTLTAVVALAIGIAANVLVFAATNALLLRASRRFDQRIALSRLAPPQATPAR